LKEIRLCDERLLRLHPAQRPAPESRGEGAAEKMDMIVIFDYRLRPSEI